MTVFYVKDIETSIALGLVYLQWLGRYLTCWGGELNTLAPPLQVVAIMTLADCSERSDVAQSAIRAEVSDEALLDFALSVGVHPTLCSCLAKLPVISRCAVFRACLNIYDDQSLLYVPSCFALQGIERHVVSMRLLQRFPISFLDIYRAGSGNQAEPYRLSLLVSYLFSCVLSMCNHSMPACRLYGLQTLEGWFGRLETLEQETAEAATLALCSPLTKAKKSSTTPQEHESSAMAPKKKSNISSKDLESWFNRAELDFSEHTATKSDKSSSMTAEDYVSSAPALTPQPLPLPLGPLLAILGAVSALLTQAWNHPSKQVRLLY